MLKQLILLSCLVATSLAAETFYVQGNKFYDPNGNEFVFRGINSAHADWDNYNRNYAYDSIPKIAESGANSIRIQWRMSLQGGLDTTYLDKIIQRSIDYKLVPIVQLHDATGSSDKNKLLDCARWFANNKALLDKYKRYIVVNIANEWSPWGTSLEFWRDSYKEAITIIRNSGWKGPLMVDASAYAQNPYSIFQYGLDVLNSDAQKNVLFSIHMYAEWKKNGGHIVGDRLWDIQQKGMVVVVGEFTLKHPEGCNWVDIDAWLIMRECEWKKIGYLGWSWQGNGQGDCGNWLDPLNIVQGDAQQKSTWTSTNYSEWGNALVWYTNFGLKYTSKKATIY